MMPLSHNYNSHSETSLFLLQKDRAQYSLNRIAYMNNVTMPKYEEIPVPADEEYSTRDFFVLQKCSK